MPDSDLDKHEFLGIDRWLIASLLAGPLAVLTHLSVSYALVREACAQGTRLPLHISAAVFFSIALAGAAAAFRIRETCDSGEGMLRTERTRWLATVASVLALASAVIIVAMAIPNFIHRICD